MRRMSFALTEPQLLDGSKTVTRRLGWSTITPGTQLRAIRKGMGLKKGERQHVLGELLVTAVRRERLDAITDDDCTREGFPEMRAADFVEFFCRANSCKPDTLVTRIEFVRLS